MNEVATGLEPGFGLPFLYLVRVRVRLRLS